MFVPSKLNYQVKLPQWSGPLDLLLDLIKTSKLDISTISLEKITDQYLLTLDILEKLSIPLTSDFLVMAATLTLIKSRKLLPQEKVEMEEIEEMNREIIENLLTYEKYKNASKNLKSLEENVFFFKSNKKSGKKTIPTKKLVDKWQNVELKDLVMHMAKITDLKKFSNNLKKIKAISLNEKIEFITKKLAQKSYLIFEELLEDPHKQEIIVTFWAILELYKNTKISLKQKEAFKEIRISLI